ncbi:MAG: ABC transporter permease [Omnitrophica WOR_2 bacterium RIFOXYB2_FULL_38_16]|nr:MAG: ABC transporter permease [Omnitrophica WOR_2 bacterium RIFOXYA2_FULL_38_17]OGX59684.1 MAG: ABC transporter permease [Omnitrophica WOR_2 bacterium RIFOXYB2_FULL_38_16]HBG61532.1 ABC transporter permease [Candidatus Omnitrophota bacterium]
MNKQFKSKSQFALALSEFKRSRRGIVCLAILGILYFGAIFADFIAPYTYDSEARDYSYASLSKVHFVDENGRFSWPFVRELSFNFDEYHKRTYVEKDNTKCYFHLFNKGDAYKLLGLLKTDRHLFGVDSPGRLYIMGADVRGRDIFSRLIYGARISLSIGLIGVSISFTLGLLIGGVAGYYGGKIDNIIMRLCEMFMMVPGFYLMLALRSAVPDSFNSFQVYLAIVVILSFIGWASLARIIRGMSITLREREYVLAAKAAGVSDLKIIIRHILPHTVSYSIVAIMLSIPGYILGEAALSLIGLGIQDPIASWGNMLSDAMAIAHIQMHPWILMPGFMIFLTVICFNVVGDTLRDCLDPLLRGEVDGA